MATMLSQCYSVASIRQRLAEMDAQIDAVDNNLQKALDALTSDEAQQAADTIDSGITDHDQLFSGSPVSSLDDAYRNAGIQPNSRSAHEVIRGLVRKGFLSINNTIYVCNQGVTRPSVPKTVDVQPPESWEELRSALADTEYKDPKILTTVAYRGQAKTGRSVTGSYINPGTVHDIRELVRGFGGDLAGARSFLVDIDSKATTGVVWSLLHYQVVHKTEDPLDVDRIRDVVDYPLYEEDVNILDDYAIVTTEVHIGTQMNRASALSLAKAMCRDLGVPGDPVLVCRLVRLTASDSVRGQSPVVSTVGFDGKKLGSNAWRLGIDVCGYKRIVDITGDRGTNTVYTEYTARSCAASISRVFGDLVAVAEVGNEISFVVNQRGLSASIGFFYVGEGDASEASGVNGLLRREEKKASGTVSSTLKTMGSVRWLGGEDVTSGVTVEFSEALAKFDIPESIVSSVYGGGNYYIDALDSSTKSVDALVALQDKALQDKSNITTYGELTGFVDIVGLSYVDACRVLDELGAENTKKLLKHYPEVYEIDIYRTSAQVREDVTAMLQESQDNDGLEVADNDYGTLTPFRKNRAKLSYFYGLYRHVTADAAALSADDAVNLRASAIGYTPSLYWDTGFTLTRRSPDTALGTSPSASVSTLWKDVLDSSVGFFSDPQKESSDALAAAIDFACRQDAELCDLLRRKMREVSEGVEAGEQWLADVMDGLGGPVGESLRESASAIAMLNRLIDRAIAAVTQAKAKATSYLQGLLGTKKSLPEVLEALANLNINVYGNMGFQTKFLSCYVSASGGILLSALWEKLIEKVNAVIERINDLLNALIEVMQKMLDLLICLADKICQGFEGAITYERSGAGTYKAAGIPMPVTFTMTCTMSFGYEGMDPALARELTKLKQKLTTLLSLFKLQVISYNKLDDSVKLYKGLEMTAGTSAAQLIGQLRDQIKQKLLDMLSC